MSNLEASRNGTPEQRLLDLGIKLPAPPQPFGAYAEAVQVGQLLFLSGMLPTVGREAMFVGRVGAELDAEAGRKAAALAARNALAVAQEHLGSLDKVKRLVPSECQWPRPGTSEIIPKWRTAPRSFCRMSSDPTITRAAWSWEWPVFHLARPSSWR